MIDYVKELDAVVDLVVEIVEELEDNEETANIVGVIKKAKERNRGNGNTLIRDAIMTAGGRGKLKIRRIPPNQYLLELPNKKV